MQHAHKQSKANKEPRPIDKSELFQVTTELEARHGRQPIPDELNLIAHNGKDGAQETLVLEHLAMLHVGELHLLQNELLVPTGRAGDSQRRVRHRTITRARQKSSFKSYPAVNHKSRGRRAGVDIELET